MPQISTIHYKDIQEAQRFDAECFVALSSILKNPIRSGFSLSDKFQVKIIDGDRGIHYPNGSDFLKDGYCVFLDTSNVLNDGFDLSSCRFISESKDEILKSGKLLPGDIVFTTRGTIGNMGIYDDSVPFEHLRINSGMVIFRFQEVLPEYAFVVMLSDFFKKQVRAYASGSVQSQFPIVTMKMIRFPLLSKYFQEEISKDFKIVQRKKMQSKKLYQEAEELLLRELGLIGYEVRHTLAFSATKREVDEAGRIDAEYFQPKYQEIIDKIEAYPGGCFALSNKNYTTISRGSLISDVYYTNERGIPYIRGADFSDGILSDEKMVYIGTDFSGTRETKVKVGDLVFSLIGSVGATAMVSDEFNQSYISNNTGRIRVKNFHPSVLQVILRSLIGQIQFEKEKTQTAQPKISAEQIGNLKIPLIRKDIQEQIAEKITESRRLRKESKELLEQAKLMVEREIEREEK